jgi:hypothetical protein
MLAYNPLYLERPQELIYKLITRPLLLNMLSRQLNLVPFLKQHRHPLLIILLRIVLASLA